MKLQSNEIFFAEILPTLVPFFSDSCSGISLKMIFVVSHSLSLILTSLHAEYAKLG